MSSVWWRIIQLLGYVSIIKKFPRIIRKLLILHFIIYTIIEFTIKLMMKIKIHSKLRIFIFCQILYNNEFEKQKNNTEFVYI